MIRPAQILLIPALALFLAYGSSGVTGKEPAVSLGSGPPLAALWRMSDGHVLRSEAPNLRVAIWGDGRVLTAEDPAKWGHALREGRISAEMVAKLRKRILETGVFELKGTCYLVPDAPVLCLLVNLDSRRQILYWDEVESPNYGINIAPKPQHLRFMACWKSLNRVLLDFRPEKTRRAEGRFGPVPTSWYPKPAIQSE